MPATFDVLVPGYLREDTDGTEHVRGTVSLICSASFTRCDGSGASPVA
jgi:hypothetical protein